MDDVKRANGDGSVYRRKSDGRWVASRMHRGRRFVRYAPRRENTRKAALAALEELSRTLDAVGSVPSRRLTVAAYLQSWLADMDLAPRTVKRYGQIVDLHLVPLLGDIPLGDLRARHVEDALGRIDRHPQTVRHVRATLRAALSEAIRKGTIPLNAAALAKPPKLPPRGDGSVLTVADARRLLDATTDDLLGPLWTLALATGMRAGELLGLTWDDVDTDAGRLTIRYTLRRRPHDKAEPWELGPPKTAGSQATVRIAPHVAAALDRHRTRMAALRQPEWRWWRIVFLTEDGSPWHADALLRRLYAAEADAGVPKVALRDFRHTTATLLLAQGYALEDVKRMLRHSTIRLTSDTYAHRDDTRQAALAAAMAELLLGKAS